MIALIDGLDINYQLSGSGRDILLLHGWGVDSTTLAVLFEHLAERFRVCSVDLPGFGQSQAPKEVWGVGEYADFVTKLLHYVDFKDPVILGHSFGGRIAILLGARGVAAKLILADSAGIKPARSCGYYLRVYSYKLAKKVLSLPGLRIYRERILGCWIAANSSTDYQAAEGILRKIFVKVVNEDLRSYLSQIGIPTLLIWGAKDTATPLTDGQLMEREIADAGLVVFEQSGHYPFLEEPARFHLIVDYFLTHDE